MAKTPRISKKAGAKATKPTKKATAQTSDTPRIQTTPTDRAAAAERRAAARAAKLAANAANPTPKLKTMKPSPLTIHKINSDADMAKYIDAKISHLQDDQHANVLILQNKIKELRTQLIETQTLLTKFIEQSTAPSKFPQPDDKYILTKAKLVKLMKDLGYY